MIQSVPAPLWQAQRQERADRATRNSFANRNSDGEGSSPLIVILVLLVMLWTFASHEDNTAPAVAKAAAPTFGTGGAGEFHEHCEESSVMPDSCWSHGDCMRGTYCSTSGHCSECEVITDAWCDPLECLSGLHCTTCCAWAELWLNCEHSASFRNRCPTGPWPPQMSAPSFDPRARTRPVPPTTPGIRCCSLARVQHLCDGGDYHDPDGDLLDPGEFSCAEDVAMEDFCTLCLLQP